MQKWDKGMWWWLESLILIVWIEFTEQEMTMARMRRRGLMHVLVDAMEVPRRTWWTDARWNWRTLAWWYQETQGARNIRKRVDHCQECAWKNHSQARPSWITCNHLWPHTRIYSFSSTQSKLEQLRYFASTPDSKQKDIPGSAHFKKLYRFMEEQVQVEWLYLEYLTGDSQKTTKPLCEFHTKLSCSASGLERVPRPMPDQNALQNCATCPLTRPLLLLQVVAT